MRLTFDLTGADMDAERNPYAPTVMPGETLDLDGLAGLLEARIVAAAEYAAVTMAAAHAGLAAVEPDLAEFTCLDGITLTLARPDTVGVAGGLRFGVRMARVRLVCAETFDEASVTVDVVGKLPSGLRMGNLTAAAHPAASESAEYGRYRAALLTELMPDEFSAAELIATWAAELGGRFTVVAAGAPVSERDAGRVLAALLTDRVARAALADAA